jgi:hypothetical protein
MLGENDKHTLVRNLMRNRVVLVTGAGFSCDALNVLGRNLPVGTQLAQSLWSYLYDTKYDGKANLKTLYEVALHHRKGRNALQAFLKAELHAETIPEWYRLVTRWFWFRIYTFNADDLLEQEYRLEPSPGLKTIIAPAHFQERDDFLRSIQYVKLHGSITSEPSDLTFGIREYGGRAAARTDIWYEHFVQDYSTKPTIFVGTELDEPLFWQYVELRGAQKPNEPRARRPKCYLVSPNISKPVEDALATYSILPVRATARQFFEWLLANAAPLIREAVLRFIDPSLEPALAAAERGIPTRDVAVIEYFYSLFKAPARPANPRNRATFLLGIPPTWEDIAVKIDADREVNRVLKDELISALEKNEVEVVVVSSAAGGGKSTVAKRVAMDLVDEGYSVFFSEGESRPDPERLAAHLSNLQDRVFLFFDNAGQDLALLAELWERVRSFKYAPIIVIVARTNDMAFRGYRLARVGSALREVQIPNLTVPDIHAILATLERHDVLGELKGKRMEERIQVFVDKARKQILVAMREATSGRGFDDIIRDEFASIEGLDAKLLYLVISLASDGDYGLTMQQIITAMDLPPRDTQVLVDKHLAGIVIENEDEPDKYFVRHPAIAHFIIESAPRDVLAEAVKAFLRTVSTVLPEGRDRRWSRAFRVYRATINHRHLQGLFIGRMDLVREIYEDVKSFYRDDGHYWLQYGSFEVEFGGDTDLAENYIKQAQALMPNNPQVDTALGHLLFKKAIEAGNRSSAESYLEEGSSIIRAQMSDTRNASLHPYHIFGSQMISYIRRWMPNGEQSEQFRSVHDELRRSIPDALRSHPDLRRLLGDLKRAELETAIRRNV